MDSITVGTEKNESLKCVSLATGGYAFHPKTLRDALRLNELETVLSSMHREPRKAPGAVTAGLGAPLNTSRGPNIVPAAEFVSVYKKNADDLSCMLIILLTSYSACIGPLDGRSFSVLVLRLGLSILFLSAVIV